MLKLNAPTMAKMIRGLPITFDEVMRGEPVAVLAIAEQFANIMREKIREPGTGRVYTTYFMTVDAGRGRSGASERVVVPYGSRPPHQASAPGEAPASDTGNLINAIQTAITANRKRFTRAAVGITGQAPYWRMLEDGTFLMEPRPFVKPSYEIGKRGAGTQFIKRQRRRTKRILAKRRVGRK